MALAIQHVKGSCSALPFVPSSGSRGSKLAQCLPTLRAGWTEDRPISLRRRLCSSIGASFVLGPKSRKLSKISAFKGTSQSGDGTKSVKKADKVSYNFQNRKEKYSEITSDFPDTKQERRETKLNALSCYFLDLNAAIKLPLLLFTPLYVAVTLVYGSKVSIELMPLWILGPLMVSLYIKMFRVICGLYAFSFKQTVQVVKNVHVYYLLAQDYTSHGKLSEDVRNRVLEPVAHMRNTNYTDWTKRRMKDLQGWFLQIYLDFIELIWPCYFRTTRFLKRANFI